MIRLLATLAVGTALAVSAPTAAQGQSMQGMDMPGMKMPAKKPAAKKVPASKPAAKKPAPKKPSSKKAATKSPPRATAKTTPAKDGMSQDQMQDMAMPTAAAGHAASSDSSMPGMDMSGGSAMPGMDMSDGRAMPGMAMASVPSGTALPAGNAPAPAPPTDHYADHAFPADEMDRARSMMMTEEGGRKLYKVMFNLAEYQFRDGKDGYRWDGEAWFGGDINRLTLKSEGEGTFREGVDSAEVQALYSRAVGPYFNLQAGIRHDFQPSPTRTYATVGFEGLAPYMFEVGGALFLSQKGDLLGRLEGTYDERITQRLILQPRVELNFAAQDVPENRIGSGLSNAELGLRLRYEIAREFAPYVGVSWDRKIGDTARYARLDGRDAETTSLVVGTRFWF